MKQVVCYYIVAFVLTSALSIPAFSQIAINTDGSQPNGSAMLDVSSTTKGFLAPRMGLASRNAISSPATGLLIYQTDNTPGYYQYDGSVLDPEMDPSLLSVFPCLPNLVSVLLR